MIIPISVRKENRLESIVISNLFSQHMQCSLYFPSFHTFLFRPHYFLLRFGVFTKTPIKKKLYFKGLPSIERTHLSQEVFIKYYIALKEKERVHTLALSVSNLPPTVLMIWQRHSMSSAASSLRVPSSWRTHWCRIASWSSPCLPSSPMNLMLPSILCLATRRASSSSALSTPSQRSKAMGNIHRT